VRMARYGNVVFGLGENLMFGESSAYDAIFQLIVDDGVPNRGHRLNIFSPNYQDVGIFEGPHADYRIMMCLDFAMGSYDLSQPSYGTL